MKKRKKGKHRPNLVQIPIQMPAKIKRKGNSQKCIYIEKLNYRFAWNHLIKYCLKSFLICSCKSYRIRFRLIYTFSFQINSEFSFCTREHFAKFHVSMIYSIAINRNRKMKRRKKLILSRSLIVRRLKLNILLHCCFDFIHLTSFPLSTNVCVCDLLDIQMICRIFLVRQQQQPNAQNEEEEEKKNTQMTTHH